MMTKLFAVMLAIVAVTAGFGGSDDRLIKKYAMMKVYESCFGPEVVDEVKREMKEACLKCSGGLESGPSSSTPPPPHPMHPAPPHPVAAPATDDIPQSPEHMTAAPPTPMSPHPVHRNPQIINNDRLQAILSLRPMTTGANRTPFPYPQQSQDQRPYFLSNLAQSLGNALYDFGNNGYGQSPTPSYYRNPYYGGGNGGNNFQSLSNIGSLFTPASGPVYQQSPYYPSFYPGAMRNSRDLDMKKQLEMMASRLEGGRKIRNITCVMQELGYLNEKLEPNFPAITDRIHRLPVPDELKADMAEGVEFCRQFSMCLPETRKDKFQLTHEFSKPMSFFRCYKQKKLEACIMKDVRERYAMARGVDSDEGEDESSSEEEDAEHSLRRSMSSKKRYGGRRGRVMASPEGDTSPLEGVVFDFLYGPGDGTELFADLPF